jgi:hypothetical protein
MIQPFRVTSRENLVAIQLDWRNVVAIQVSSKTCVSIDSPTLRPLKEILKQE